MNLDYGIIGERIRQERKNKGITQDELANEVGFSVAFLSRVERGASQINLKRLTQISEILEISLGYLLTGAETSSKNYLTREFCKVLEECSSEKQKLIYNIAELIASIKLV